MQTKCENLIMNIFEDKKIIFCAENILHNIIPYYVNGQYTLLPWRSISILTSSSNTGSMGTRMMAFGQLQEPLKLLKRRAKRLMKHQLTFSTSKFVFRVSPFNNAIQDCLKFALYSSSKSKQKYHFKYIKYQMPLRFVSLKNVL